MKLISRDFTALEKLILLILTLILMGLGYYRFIDQPVRQGIEEADAQCEKLQTDLNDVNDRIQEYVDRLDELNEAKELRRSMPSYNSSEEEIRILNNVLSEAQRYSFDVEKITLSENQIRRNFTFAFTAPDFDDVQRIFANLSESRVRCLIGNVECSGLNVTPEGVSINVRAGGAFYETLVDAERDAVIDELLAEQSRSIPTSNKDASEEQAAA